MQRFAWVLVVAACAGSGGEAPQRPSAPVSATRGSWLAYAVDGELRMISSDGVNTVTPEPPVRQVSDAAFGNDGHLYAIGDGRLWRVVFDGAGWSSTGLTPSSPRLLGVVDHEAIHGCAADGGPGGESAGICLTTGNGAQTRLVDRGGLLGIGVADGRVFWAEVGDAPGRRLYSVPLGGGEPTFHGEIAREPGAPTISADGAWIAWTEDGKAIVQKIGDAGQRKELALDGVRLDRCAFGVDVLACTADGDGDGAADELRVIGLDGVPRLAQRDARVSELRWAPDGEELAYGSGDVIKVVSSEGGLARELGQGPGVRRLLAW